MSNVLELLSNCKVAEIPLLNFEWCGRDPKINLKTLNCLSAISGNTLLKLQDQHGCAKRLLREVSKKHLQAKPPNLLPDYANKGAKAPDIQKKSSLNTEKYKRISPEFYKLLNERPDSKNLAQKNSSEEISPIRGQINVGKTLHKNSFDDRFPALAQYLKQLMQSDDVMNKIYKIDFTNDFKTKDSYKTEHRQPLDLEGFYDIMQKIGEGKRYSPEDFKFLEEFVNSASKMDKAESKKLIQFIKTNLGNDAVDNFKKLMAVDQKEVTGTNIKTILDDIRRLKYKDEKYIQLYETEKPIIPIPESTKKSQEKYAVIKKPKPAKRETNTFIPEKSSIKNPERFAKDISDKENLSVQSWERLNAKSKKYLKRARHKRPKYMRPSVYEAVLSLHPRSRPKREEALKKVTLLSKAEQQ